MSTPLKKPRSSSAKRVAAYRKRMRDQGLVPKTIWVRDKSDPDFLAEYDRQCRAIASSAEEAEVMAWIEALQADLDLGPIPEYRLPGEK